jgi:hypothetical protein
MGKAAAGVWGWSRQFTGRENLEQFRTTESLAWASGNSSYSLRRTFSQQCSTDISKQRNCILLWFSSTLLSGLVICGSC